MQITTAAETVHAVEVSGSAILTVQLLLAVGMLTRVAHMTSH
jgi:hypothetical protein